MSVDQSGSAPPLAIDTLISGGIVVTMSDARDVWDPGYVAIRGAEIVAVGPMTSAPTVANTHIDANGKVVFPGLINCHAHHGATLLRGVFDEMDLKDWMKRGLWPGVRSLDEEYSYAGAKVAISELLLSGVTTSTSSDWSFPHLEGIHGVFRAIEESGMRARVSRITQDSPETLPESQAIPPDIREQPSDVVRHVDELRNRFESGRLKIGPEPLNEMRCTEAMVRELHRYAREEDTFVMMHVASSKSEAEGCKSRYGLGCVEYLDSIGCLHDRLLIAHAIWLSPDELKIIGESGAGVSHNPVSNLYYATGVASLADMLDFEVNVGLGVDTAATNNSQNIWETMKMAMFLSKQKREDAAWGSAELALELATRGGAKALGMDTEIGALEVGKRADLILVSTERAHLTPTTRLISNLVYSPNPDAIDTVLVDGELLVSGGQLTRWQLPEVLETANLAAVGLLNAAGLDPAMSGRTSWRWNPSNDLLESTD